MRFEFFIAMRYLRAKRRQAVVGVITAISVIGVAAGVASLIIALAITNGMQQDLQARLVGSTSHVDLMRIKADGIRDWQPLLAKLGKLPHVTAAAPGLYGQVLISRGVRSGGALIKGVIPADERKVGDLLQSVTVGSAKELRPVEAASSVHPTLRHEAAKDGAPDLSSVQAIPPIVIGKDLAETLGASVGDTVQVISPQG
ncbi:MAG: ABC transporter permease, partial [Edaphobacter sp.]